MRRQSRRYGKSLEELSFISAYPHFQGGGVHLFGEFRPDGDHSFGGRRGIRRFHAQKPFFTARRGKPYRVDPQLCVERHLNGDLFGGSDYLRLLRGGTLRECGLGIRRAA